ncbi:MAG: DivIVA domain-containing protein [Balneolales bacterium]|nr:DivIVA domain-containing protein [Balneolales bacterium]
MNITALEIKQRTFAKSIRGYDVAEVNAFLSMLANEWEHQVVKMKDLERDLKQINDKLQHYQRIEATLHETLQTARDNAEQRLENARRDAKNKIEKAELEAENVLQEARQQRQQIKQSIHKLLERRDEIIRGMSSYLDLAQKSLETFQRDNADIYALPQEDEPPSNPLSSYKSGRSRSATSAAAAEAGLAPGTEDIDDLLDEID